MTTTTQCPVCGTRFKATQAQLEAYRGMVRCGHCHAAFNAIENRTSMEPSPQLDLPIVLEDMTPPQQEAVMDITVPLRSEMVPAAADKAEEDAAEETPGEPRVWPWALAGLLAGVLALAQLAYLFRTELAAHLPGLKPALVAACGPLHCSIPLPRNIDLMAIDASNMETDPAQPSIITLSVTLHNLAPYPQSYPYLELTLTDLNDMPVGRRVFRPDEYLKNPGDAKTGLGGNRDASIRLAIDATGLHAVGYRLFLSY
ncbi:MAG TPA: zinc-ribbon and DUF3426 domain-containing protein [Gallionellaceae bacterium]|nr:zinc-ribbon and DUF3426 domain-containing protein [Gallionellaceae bacterium]